MRVLFALGVWWKGGAVGDDERGEREETACLGWLLAPKEMMYECWACFDEDLWKETW